MPPASSSSSSSTPLSPAVAIAPPSTKKKSKRNAKNDEDTKAGVSSDPNDTSGDASSPDTITVLHLTIHVIHHLLKRDSGFASSLLSSTIKTLDVNVVLFLCQVLGRIVRQYIAAKNSLLESAGGSVQRSDAGGSSNKQKKKKMTTNDASTSVSATSSQYIIRREGSALNDVDIRRCLDMIQCCVDAHMHAFLLSKNKKSNDGSVNEVGSMLSVLSDVVTKGRQAHEELEVMMGWCSHLHRTASYQREVAHLSHHRDRHAAESTVLHMSTDGLYHLEILNYP